MKVRVSFVSNSSSSSYIIFNWFDIPEYKRKYIKEYVKNSEDVWLKNNRQYKSDSYGLWLADTSEDDALNFGFISSGWDFEEYVNRNVCIVSTDMDNFDMGRWLKYNDVDHMCIEHN